MLVAARHESIVIRVAGKQIEAAGWRKFLIELQVAIDRDRRGIDAGMLDQMPPDNDWPSLPLW